MHENECLITIHFFYSLAKKKDISQPTMEESLRAFLEKHGLYKEYGAKFEEEKVLRLEQIAEVSIEDFRSVFGMKFGEAVDLVKDRGQALEEIASEELYAAEEKTMCRFLPYQWKLWQSQGESQFFECCNVTTFTFSQQLRLALNL